MRVRWLSVLLVLSLPALALAEAPAGPVDAATAAPSTAPSQDAAVPAEPPPVLHGRRERAESPERPIALGVNTPLGWYRGSFGGSVYVGLSRHDAVRANFAYFESATPLITDLANSFGGGEIPSYSGKIKDYGIGWVWYSSGQQWQGFMFEAGALRRDRAVRMHHEFETIKNWTTTYAGRAMIGWSWRFGPTFVAAAVGLSAGREAGLETTKPNDYPPMPATSREIARLQVDGEAYLRIGFAIGD